MKRLLFAILVCGVMLCSCSKDDAPAWIDDFVGAWDGTTVTQIEDVDTTSHYEFNISSAAEFIWLLEEFNSSSADSMVIVNILSDLNFGDHILNPRHRYDNYQINGNNHTLSHFKVRGVVDTLNSEPYMNAGLFPHTSQFSVSDLVISNATIGMDVDGTMDVYAGALMGTIESASVRSEITGVSVRNSKITGVNKVGALVGQSSPIVSYVNCTASNCIVSGIGPDGGAVGGLLGYVGVAYTNDVISNCSVSGGSVIVAQGINDDKRASSAFIGTIYPTPLQTGTLNINNCSTSGVNLTYSNTPNPLNELVGAMRGGVVPSRVFINGVDLDTAP